MIDRLARRALILHCTVVVSSTLAVGQVLPPVPVPPGNPITVPRVNLGKALFFDEQLSSTGTVACATCHALKSGGRDPRSAGSLHPGFDLRFGTEDDVHGSPGVIGNAADGSYVKTPLFGLDVQVTGRRAPPVVNAAYNPVQFWDGRAGARFVDPLNGAVVLPTLASLETQASEPPVSDAEMAHAGRDWRDVAARVANARPLALASDLPAALAAWISGADYGDLFARAFGSRDVTPARIAMAIATYERTLISDQAPIDRFLAGDRDALSPEERLGFDLFNGRARCNRCHPLPLFTDHRFLNIGVRPTREDRGRFGVTGNRVDQGAFKVPSLRNVGLRAPYFHNGGKRSLAEVVEFYDHGGDFPRDQTRLIGPLGLSASSKHAIVRFLDKSLTDPRVANGLPPFDGPTLYSESSRVPARYGGGAAGSAGVTPRMVGIEPPMAGNPSFTLALADGLGGAPAVLLLDVLPDSSGRVLSGVPLQVAGTGAIQLVPLGRLHDLGAGAGYWSLGMPLPADPALSGVSLYFQGVVADPGASEGLAATAGLRVTFFAAR